MAGFFYKLGQMVGPKVRKANWVVTSLTGTEAEVTQAEYRVGVDLAKGFLEQTPVIADPAVTQIMDEVGGRLANCVKDRQRRFRFYAVQSRELNAFALPGGFIFIQRPLLEFCGWDRDEIAFVLGHEMGHVIKRHAIHRLMASSVIQTGVTRLPIGGVLGAPVRNLAATLLNQGYSQDQELEADALGVRLTLAAGYDAGAGRRLLARMQTMPGEAWVLTSYFSSHPPVDVRVNHMARVERGG
ncbi:MAG: M48 family metallopeptidase [Gemmataceae bacterium]|nr:M48 family metallopeptidase [Gemmataceae bacterium]